VAGNAMVGLPLLRHGCESAGCNRLVDLTHIGWTDIRIRPSRITHKRETIGINADH
jgi:hypothetical protein